jgi:hypothetical protein
MISVAYSRAFDLLKVILGIKKGSSYVLEPFFMF